MKVSQLIIDKILTDNQFSLKGAAVLGIAQISFQQLARRNSTKLTLYNLVEFYKEEGFTEEQIFEKETSQ